MKNHKGEIATLLTLGLVLIGGLVTLATSFFVNRQNNLASNPRAGGPTGNCKYAPAQFTDCSVACGGYGRCIKCSSGFYRCVGTTDDSITSTPRPPTNTPTPVKAGSGNQWPRDASVGYDEKGILCPNANLEYACCVQYNDQCGQGKHSYTWYGCTGQPCGNTKISQSNGPGQLVACIPNGITTKGANKTCAVASTPTPVSTTNFCEQRNSISSTYSYKCQNTSSSCDKLSPAGAYEPISGSTYSCGVSTKGCCRALKSELTPTPSGNGTPAPATTTAPSGLPSARGSGTTCYPSNQQLRFRSVVFTDSSTDLTSPMPCGGVPIYDKPDGTILRECGATSNSTCKYTCFDKLDNKTVFCVGTVGIAARKITIINNLGEDIEIRGLMTNKSQNYPIDGSFINGTEPNNYLTFDFGRMIPDCNAGAMGSNVVLTIQYKKVNGPDEWSQSFQRSDRCEGWLNSPSGGGDVNILIKLSP